VTTNKTKEAADDEPDRSSAASEMAAVVEQVELWARLQARLFLWFKFPLVSSFWPCTVVKFADGVLVLKTEDGGQGHLIDVINFDRVETQRIDGNAIVTLTSRTGDFQIVICDILQNDLETGYKQLVSKRGLIH